MLAGLGSAGSVSSTAGFWFSGSSGLSVLPGTSVPGFLSSSLIPGTGSFPHPAASSIHMAINDKLRLMSVWDMCITTKVLKLWFYVE